MTVVFPSMLVLQQLQGIFLCINVHVCSPVGLSVLVFMFIRSAISLCADIGNESERCCKWWGSDIVSPI